jgi:hypothetical protein
MRVKAFVVLIDPPSVSAAVVRSLDQAELVETHSARIGKVVASRVT